MIRTNLKILKFQFTLLHTLALNTKMAHRKISKTGKYMLSARPNKHILKIYEQVFTRKEGIKLKSRPVLKHMAEIYDS